MTRFGVLFDRRGRPLEPAALAGVHRALGAHRRQSETRPQTYPCYYFCSENGDGAELSVALVGSIDNLVDLARTLHLSSAHNGLAEVLAAGYRRWGPALWPRLEGSFGLAFFEPSRSEVHLVCDALGGRPLFYFEEGSTVAIASEIEILLRWPDKRWGLDPLELARFFALQIPSAGRTHFAGVRQVVGGAAITLTSGGQTERRFWTPERISLRAPSGDSETAREFRERLETAVGSFVREPGRVGIMLSGGLDSTSLAALASRAAAGSGDRVAACSWVFDDLGVCDERSWIDQTLAGGDYEVIRAQGDRLWPLADPDLFSSQSGSPEENPYRALKRALYLEARDRGRTVLLNGGPADVLQRGGNLYLRGMLRDGRWLDGWRALRRQIEDAGVRAGLGALARIVRPQGRRAHVSEPPAWMSAEGRAALVRRSLGSGDRSPTYRDVARHVGRQARSQALERQYARTLGVDVVSPYWTLDFVEFMLSLPAHQVYRPGTTKFIAREAMRGLIPEPIRLRQHPTLLDPLFERGLLEREEEVVGDLLRGGAPLWPRFVDAEAVANVSPGSKPAHKVLLWRCVSFELWRRKHGWELA